MKKCIMIPIGFLAAIFIGGCSAPQPMPSMASVDLERFMGDWYVVASIPTFLERNAYNPIESYRLDTDGSIATTFSFNEGGFDGEKRTFHPRGYVRDAQSNAVWGMQFIWPIKADYRIVFVDERYEYTLVGREKRDYVWIMARHPNVDESVLNVLMDRAVAVGYEKEKIVRARHVATKRDVVEEPLEKSDK